MLVSLGFLNHQQLVIMLGSVTPPWKNSRKGFTFRFETKTTY